MVARVLLYSIGFVLAVMAIRSLFGRRLPSGRPDGRAPGRSSGEEVLVRDPQCGIYLPRTTGLKRMVRGQEHYFCSKECLEAYLLSRES